MLPFFIHQTLVFFIIFQLRVWFCLLHLQESKESEQAKRKYVVTFDLIASSAPESHCSWVPIELFHNVLLYKYNVRMNEIRPSLSSQE